MTRLTFINPPGLYDPRPNGYSHVVVAEAPARLIYIAGQGGEGADGVLSEDFGTQVQQALNNLRTALGAMWGGHPAPACTLIPVPRLALDGMLFEIEATAVH